MTKQQKTADTGLTPLAQFKLTRLVLTSANYDFYRDNPEIVGEQAGGISTTVPGSNLSLEEILQRFSAGQPMDHLVREVNYSENEYIPNFRAMDMVEVQQYREELNEQITQRIQAMDAATREIAIRDGVLPKELSDQIPLAETPIPKQPAEPQPSAAE